MRACVLVCVRVLACLCVRVRMLANALSLSPAVALIHYDYARALVIGGNV